MTTLRKQLNKLLLTVVCLLLTTTFAFAALVCGLNVQLTTDNGQPAPDIRVEILQVARTQNDTLALTADFDKLGLDPNSLTNDPDSADAVWQYVCAHDLTGSTHTSDSNGRVTLTGLEPGLYLVMERGGQSVTFDPYLVELPSRINGVIQPVVTSAPKLSEVNTAVRSVVKLWDDNDNAAGKRPADLTVTLLRDGVPVRRVTLSENTLWQYTFRELPESGTYTVEEDTVPGYTGTVTAVANGFVLRNTYEQGGPGGGGGGFTPEEPERAHVTVTKVWDDDNDAAGKRPSRITVQLVADGEVIRTAALRKANHWQYTFRDLDAEKRYTVREIPVDGYAASYTGSAAAGICITNHYTGETDPGIPPPPVVPEPAGIDIPVRVDWVDENNLAGARPNEVTVHLLSSGSIVATLHIRPMHTANEPAVAEFTVDGELVMTASLVHYSGNSWYGVFKNAPADLRYSVWEDAVPNYTTSYSGSASEGFVVTNVYTPGTTDPGVPPEPDDPISPPLDDETPGGGIEAPEEELPMIPQTGAQLLPVWLLMAAGTLMVLFGLVDLYKGRDDV